MTFIIAFVLGVISCFVILKLFRKPLIAKQISAFYHDMENMETQWSQLMNYEGLSLEEDESEEEDV